jgi:hypothetical protein
LAREVAKFSLAARSSRTVDLPAQDDLPIKNSVMVASNLLPGQVASRFISWGDSLVRAVELEAKDADNVQNGGEHPWSIQDGGSATMLMFNHSEAPKKVRASIVA